MFSIWEEFCIDNSFSPYVTFTVIVVNNNNVYSASNINCLYAYTPPV